MCFQTAVTNQVTETTESENVGKVGVLESSVWPHCIVLFL